MNRFIMASLVSFTLIFSSFPSWSADFNKGATAYNSRDFKIALREWTTLAEQGHAGSQYALG